MASLIWLIVWIVQGTPNLEWFGSWNDWAVGLLGCIIFDVLWRQSLVDEPLEPSQGRSLVTCRIDVRKEFAQRERVGKRESAHLPRSHLCGLDVTAMNRVLEASVWRA
jgi:hypothetical protein